MKLLELFCGTKSVSHMANKLGYETITLDNNSKYEPDINNDILKWNYKKFKPGSFRVIWASPPCTEFSIAKTRGKRNLTYAIKLVARTLDIINYLKPKYFIIENPVGLLRHMKVMHYINKYRNTASYCKYGYNYRKNTDIWTNAKVFLKQCKKGTYCKHKHLHGIHSHTAQSGVDRKSHQIHTTNLEQRISIPKSLVKSILNSTF